MKPNNEMNNISVEQDESIDMDNISRRTLDPCGSINSETCLLSDTKGMWLPAEFLIKDNNIISNEA